MEELKAKVEKLDADKAQCVPTPSHATAPSRKVSERLRMRRFVEAKQFKEAGVAKEEKEAAAKLLEEK